MLRQVTTSKERTVTFLLPGSGTIPTGGFKIAYEYANHLAERGWRVRIVHPRLLTLEDIGAARVSLASRARQWLGYQRRRITGQYRPDSWFKINPKVELLHNMTLDARSMPPSDVWVATFWYTAKWVANCPGARLYLIQHLETWCGPEAEVMATWKLPLRKVVISRWLEDVARSLGEPADYVPNGLDFDTFGMDVAPEKRDPHAVAMLYHLSDWKGSADGLAALHKAKAIVPALKADIFGVCPCPSGLPSWVEYHQNPPQRTLREIYNRAAIFLAPSWEEGWGLPAAEALQCGAALAATDIGGHREFAIHGETALLSPPKDPNALAANVLRLLEDQELRLRLAHQGHQHIQQFTWSRAVTSFESVLEDALAQVAENDSVPGRDAMVAAR
jgi:glycosyltransferase involved in cell wall biosynthesis